MNAPVLPPKTPFDSLWHAAYGALLDALFPPRCAGCARWSRAVFCPDCTSQLVRIRSPLCDCCGAPFDPLAFPAPICARCRAKAPDFRAARAVFAFEGPLRESIHRLKYQHKSALAPRLAPFLATTLGEEPVLRDFDPQFLVPIPLHPSRLKKRGFNQSFLLANELSKLLGVPTRELLLRSRDTLPQIGLNASDRAKNVRGAFEAARQVKTWQGKRILLIDDVFTTGATLNEAAKTLRQAGASAVCTLTLARHLLPS